MTGPFAEAQCLLVAHAGSPEGHPALAPALRVLARWAGTSGARLLGLWAGPPPALARGVTDRDLSYTARGDLDLGGEAPDAAVILTDPGHTALDLAYALHLAGVPRRAGFATEFGGGVLTDPLPPADLPRAERHLAILSALELGWCEAVHGGLLRRRAET